MLLYLGLYILLYLPQYVKYKVLRLWWKDITHCDLNTWRSTLTVYPTN